MTTRGKKVRDVKKEKVWFKFGGRGESQDTQEADPEVGRLAREGQHLKAEMNALGMKLEGVKAKLLELAEVADVPDSGTVNIVVDNRKACSIAYKEDVIVGDVVSLEKKLGKKLFSALTRQRPKPKFYPSENLMDMASEDEEIAACLTTVRKNPYVSYNV